MRKPSRYFSVTGFRVTNPFASREAISLKCRALVQTGACGQLRQSKIGFFRETKQKIECPIHGANRHFAFLHSATPFRRFIV